MKLTYDPVADAAYLSFKEIGFGEAAKTVVGEGDAEGVNLDFDAEGRLLGVEILDAKSRLPGESLRRAEKP